MTSSTAPAVTFRVHHEPEGWWADSPQIPAWSAAAGDRAELEQFCREAAHQMIDPNASLIWLAVDPEEKPDA